MKRKSIGFATDEKQIMKKLDLAKPVDYSFKNMKSLRETSIDGARASRLGGLAERGPVNKKFLSKAVWLNNNKLKSFRNLDKFIDSILERPELLGWLDVSFNYITEIDEVILKYTNLKILYMHGNCISDIDELLKLRHLNQLKTITFHGNPISNTQGYRNYVIGLLPSIVNLDFAPVLKIDRDRPAPPELIRKIREENKANKSN